MAQSNNGRIIAIAVITLTAVVSILLVMAVVYLFFQVNHLQEENRNLRSKWQKLQAFHPESEKKQKKTVEICCGVKGKRGRPGVKGVQGEKGDLGRDGLPGNKGEIGSTGSPGVKGDQGICGGPCGENLMANKKDTPLLHMTGDGKQDKKINNLEAVAVPFWNVTEKAGDIAYSNGYLTIKVEGFYYIYSQMTYCGKTDSRVGHTMSINGKAVLKSTRSGKGKNEETHNVGSIFKLKDGDKITVSPLITNLFYCFSREEAYFGAFLVRN